MDKEVFWNRHIWAMGLCIISLIVNLYVRRRTNRKIEREEWIDPVTAERTNIVKYASGAIFSVTIILFVLDVLMYLVYDVQD